MSGHWKKPRILCLSRSTSQLNLILSHFAEAEFETVPASSPEDAVAFCAANQVHAIVLDSEFVTESGWTVTQSFRMVAPQLPIVLVKSEADLKVPPGVDAIATSADLVLGTLKILLAKANSQSPATDSEASKAKLVLMKKLS